MRLRKFFINIAHLWIMFIWSVLVLAALASGLFLFMAQFREDIVTTFDIHGRKDIEFKVYYLPNHVWEDNPKPPNLHFLMSFTDFIEVTSSLTTTFSEVADVEYSYEASKRLVLTYMGTVGGAAAPPLYEERYVLSSESGHERASQLRLGGANPYEPGGTYQIDPRPFIDTYFEFMTAQAEQMRREGLVAGGFRGISAELFIDFTYTIHIPEHGVFERITRGYRLLLTGEVYSLLVTGDPAPFHESVNILFVPGGIEVGIPAIALLVAVFIIGIIGFAYSLRKILADPNPHIREAMGILRKYAGEIVVSDKAVDMTQYIPMAVEEFPELLKLAVNLNKHIMCYHDSDHAEFAAIVEGYAYVYSINYNYHEPTTQNKPAKPPKQPKPPKPEKPAKPPKLPKPEKPAKPIKMPKKPKPPQIPPPPSLLPPVQEVPGKSNKSNKELLKELKRKSPKS